MRRTWLIATWIGATALVSWVTFQALASAQDGVGDVTLAPAVVSAADSTRGSAGTSLRQPTTTAASATSTTAAASGTSTITAADGTSAGLSTREPSDDPASAPTTTSTAPSPSSTSTTVTTTSTSPAAAAWQTRVVDSGGGTVTVRFRPGEVQYQAAVPAPGYQVEIDETSPEVRVEFVGGDTEWDVRIRWDDGGLDIDVSD